MDRRLFNISLIIGALGLGTRLDADTLSQIASAVNKSGGLSNGDADKGIREALSQGTVSAVTRVGKTDGYWGDKTIRIPLPKSLTVVQKSLKPLGLSGPLDEVHSSMNHAAEQAAPVAKDLFLDAIRSLTLKDAIGIVKGGPTSGTQYLKGATTPRLTTLFTPPIASALEQTGAVTALDHAITRNSLKSYVKEDPKTFLSKHAVAYALSGLFYYVGEEESAIRHDPAKRTSDILKHVFG